MPVLSLGIDGDGEPDLSALTPIVRNILRNAGAAISVDPKHVTCIFELIERTLLEGADAQVGDLGPQTLDARLSPSRLAFMSFHALQ